MNLSVTEILAIIAIGLVLFGGKLPEVARNIGKTMHEFKQGMNDTREENTEPEQLADSSEASDEAEEPKQD
ncbi:MAG: twin-arginine translocase TatA/TatE family subunit [Planctomycetes bacterium]|nr:twin-arginine translocase TatA/TatE family subunit [Planctomycetota bacterium]